MNDREEFDKLDEVLELDDVGEPTGETVYVAEAFLDGGWDDGYSIVIGVATSFDVAERMIRAEYEVSEFNWKDANHGGWWEYTVEGPRFEIYEMEIKE